MKFNQRLQKIINLLREHHQLSPQQIHQLLGFEQYSRPTINRDLVLLLAENKIIKTGSGPQTIYRLNQNPLLDAYDPSKYFDLDYRTDIIHSFNRSIFSDLKNLFSEVEKELLKYLSNLYHQKIFAQSKYGIQKEYERLSIEFAYKSSNIEGNTYSLLDTERLIKERVEAPNHLKSEAQMILNHKEAFDFILAQPDYFKEISLFKIKELHHIIVKELDVSTDIRSSSFGIIGTNYKPLDNRHEIIDALEQLMICLNNTHDPLEKALIAVAMLSYIQPFEDGNKRTGRIVANAILIAHNLIPISFIGVDSIEYKKAIILFYEKNSITYLKKILIEQYNLSIDKYF